MTRRMKLGLSLASVSADSGMSFDQMARYAHIGEAGKFDFVFATARPQEQGHVQLDTLTLMAALAAVTSRVGLVAPGSAQTQDPFHLARKLASIDHLSEGRAGWSLVTSISPDEAQNFGLTETLDSQARYERAREFHDVVQRTFTSWDADAFPRDVASGVYLDRSKMHRLEHVGKYFKVRGPSDVARPPQSILPLVTTGMSATAQDFAAEAADIVHDGQSTIEGGRAEYTAVKARLPRYGRSADSLRVMPGTGAADGVMILPPYLPSGAEDFVALVIPELQRRGLFRTEYEGRTLRENLGLPISR
jgi:alkanesulfonate monooxygenase SsuD/methylene tetrahydromethanopterin reductase-like flavin-dependent oxidoreductase (luciferase family)